MSVKTVFICQHDVNMCIECAVTMNNLASQLTTARRKLEIAEAALMELRDFRIICPVSYTRRQLELQVIEGCTRVRDIAQTALDKLNNPLREMGGVNEQRSE